jgi:hypothetical protein
MRVGDKKTAQKNRTDRRTDEPLPSLEIKWFGIYLLADNINGQLLLPT